MILALRRLRQEGHKSKVSLNNLSKPCLKIHKPAALSCRDQSPELQKERGRERERKGGKMTKQGRRRKY